MSRSWRDGWADDRVGWIDGGLTELAEVVGLSEQVVPQEGVEGADWRRVSEREFHRVETCDTDDSVSRSLQPGVLEKARV